MFANNKGCIGLFQQTTGLTFGHFFYTLQVDHRQIRYKDPKWWEMDFLCQRSTARGTDRMIMGQKKQTTQRTKIKFDDKNGKFIINISLALTHGCL